MRRRSNLLVVLGLVSFVLGLLAVYLITSDDEDGVASGSDTVEVLVAAEDLDAGSLGEDVLREGRYRIEEVPLAQRQPDALVAPSQLSGTTFTLSFAEGEQIRSEGLRTVGGARAQIPEGFEAVPVSVDFVAGGANTIVPGDRVNVYMVSAGTAAPAAGAEGEVAAPSSGPRTELLLTNTLVLDVQQGTSPLQVSQPQDAAAAAPSTGGTLIVVLALDTLDAEKVIFATETAGSSLYFSRVRVDEQNNPAPPVESTPGVDFGTVLAEEAGEAFRRSNG